MNLSSKELLRLLGSGRPIAEACRAAGISRDEFDRWWDQETGSRVPTADGSREVPVGAAVEIERDEWGIPHIHAESDDDLFLGFGYAMAQDRLFQLDYLRRKALGRLAEVLGPDGLDLDLIARTIGIRRIAEAEWEQTPEETRRLVSRFSDGVNAVIDESRKCLPIEFDLLDYTPEPWTPVDCLAIAGEFRYYLNVRFPVIVAPEIGRRVLGDGPLFDAFLQGEADEESIMPAGSYPAGQSPAAPMGSTVGDPQEGEGSNNWVISGTRTTTGKPLLASDPHIAFAAVSCWYEVHLSGGSFDVMGMAYAGMPAVLFGANRKVAWGVTNNICSQRDLYLEKTDPNHPGCFLYDGQWEPARKTVEEITVRGTEPVQKTIRSSRNGPIVNDILPPPARDWGPISLCWVGSSYCGLLTSYLAMNRANSCDEFRESTKGWTVPTWSLVFADLDGHIGYQTTGHIPLRKFWRRGLLEGWNPGHQWDGVIPREGMPQWADPERGWIATANNRPVPDDFPYPLSGVWNSGHRCRRIRQMIEQRGKLSRDDLIAMQQDVCSLRAVECAPKLVRALSGSSDSRIREALAHLEAWDGHMTTGSVAASIFEVFFTQWSRRAAAERFDEEQVLFVEGTMGGLASALLDEDTVGWFEGRDRVAAIEEALSSTLDEITAEHGPDMSQWQWGNLHKIQLRHVLTGRGDLSELLDRGGVPVGGNGITVCNTGYDPNWGALMGANYRLIADLSTLPLTFWAVDAQGESGHPGSEHYCDQLDEWINARYHELPFEKGATEAGAKLVLRSSGAA